MQAYEQISEERKDWVNKSRLYYDKWNATLSKQEQKKEDERRYNEGACASENRIGKTDWVDEYESLIQKGKKTKQNIKIKDEINFIDEDSEEEVVKPAPIKKVIREITSESESESDSDTLELNEDENILSILDEAESEELEEKKAPKQTRNKKNLKEVIQKATKK